MFFFVWLATGCGFILYGLYTMKAIAATKIFITLMGLMVLVQPVTGITMLASKTAGKILPKVHISSAILMLVFDVCAFVSTVVG